MAAYRLSKLTRWRTQRALAWQRCRSRWAANRCRQFLASVSENSRQCTSGHLTKCTRMRWSSLGKASFRQSFGGVLLLGLGLDFKVVELLVLLVELLFEVAEVEVEDVEMEEEEEEEEKE